MMEISQSADYKNMSDISSETAYAVLDTCIRLRGTNDFKATMKDVVAGVRELCDAEHCCILILDEYERSYKEFVNRFFAVNEESFTDFIGSADKDLGSGIISAIESCKEEGSRAFITDRLGDGATLHGMVKKITDSPVPGGSAYAVIVLDITPEREQITYANVAQSLSADYEYLYYVDTDTDQFVEYSHEGSGQSLLAERHGEGKLTVND